MKKIVFILCIQMIIINSYGQSIDVEELIPKKTSTDYNWIKFVHNSANYGGVVMSVNNNWFGKAGSTTYYTAGDKNMNFWTQTGNIIFFPTSGLGGNVGIGTTDPQSKLAVNGQIRATEVKVLADITVPDYVFEPDYALRTLKETKEYIAENKHLPEIPSASEIDKNGIDLGDMNMRLLKKIEELTLYQIELLERLEKAEGKILKLENK